MLTCKEVVKNADWYLTKEQPFLRRLSFRFHLLICKHCARYIRQFQALKGAIPFMHRKASDDEVARVMDSIDD